MKRLFIKKHTCPICQSDKFNYRSFSEEGYGVCEQYGYCNRCGYNIIQCYSPISEYFVDIKRGYKSNNGTYISKNIKKHKRIRRKLGINKKDYTIYYEEII